MIDIKQLTQQKNELKELWDYLGIDAAFPDKQVRQWLLDYPFDLIESGIKVLAAKEYKVEEPVPFLAGVLRKSKERNMTPEQREEQISFMRSAVGKLGAAARHAKEIAYIKQEFAQVCQDLPELAKRLPDFGGSDCDGVGVGVKVSVSLSEKAMEQVKEPVTVESKAAASPLCSTARTKEEKQTPEPTPTPTPTAVSSSSANQSQTRKTKTCKKCGATLDRSKSHTCPLVKTQDELVASAQGGYFDGDAGCQGCGKVRRNWNSDWCVVCWDKRQKVKAAAASGRMDLGNVDGL